jgi:hypothetical protein
MDARRTEMNDEGEEDIIMMFMQHAQLTVCTFSPV